MEERRVTPVPGHGPMLIIGYGNSLRGDDGAGLEVARLLVEGMLPSVRIYQVGQLMPELASDVAAARAAIFVDARWAVETAGVTMAPLNAAEHNSTSDHAIAPQDILRLEVDCYGRVPPSWVVAVGGREFGFCEGLSNYAKSNVRAAVQLITEHINRLASDGNRVLTETNTIVA
jgi:hydrogenase maturation protease